MSKEQKDSSQYRAAFQQDEPDYYEQSSPVAPYPDAAYKTRERTSEDDGTFSAPPRQFTQPVYDDGRKKGSASRNGLWLFIALICACVLALMLYAINSWHLSYAPFRTMADAIYNQATFAQGICVDGVNIGGMTRAEAESALSRSYSSTSQTLGIVINVNGNTFTVTESYLPFTRNLSTVLDEAWNIGRSGTMQTLGSSVTPLMYRYQHRVNAQAAGAYFYTNVTYDKGDIRNLVNEIASYVQRSAQDAQVATFDFSSRSFTFTDDVQGVALNTDELFDRIVACLDTGNYTATINMDVTTILPAVTKVELMNSFTKISAYSTQTTSNANRNNNIDLACQAVSNTVVMPGETFSFNEATGQRTTEKGYLPAAAIAGGTTVDEVGGGVCQVSSTLFNAATMADMTLVYRSPHTWPSTYVDKGRDATVNWPNLDYKFKNDRTTPIFIVAWYQNRTCTVEIYGMTLGTGESRDIITEVTSTTQAPSEPLYTNNPSLLSGETNVLKKAHTGYTVDTYKVYLRDGAEYKRELYCSSTYKMIQEVIEYN